MQKLTCTLLAAAFVAVSGCADETPPPSPAADHTDFAANALTAAQCNYFAVDGKIQICHKTSSVTKPYQILRVSEQACINGHSDHADDYVTSTNPADSTYDPTCSGQGCLSVGAPCDPTLPCCDGLTCTNGTCQAPASVCPCAANPGWGALLAQPGVEVVTSNATWDTYVQHCNNGDPGLSTEGFSFYFLGVEESTLTSGLESLQALDPNSATYCDDFSDGLGNLISSLVSVGGVLALNNPAIGSFCNDSLGDLFPTTPDQDAACKAEIHAAAVAQGQSTPVPDMPFPIAMLAPGLVGLAEIGRRIAKRNRK